MPSGARGWPDLVVFGADTIWLVEVKVPPGDYLRQDQIDFFQKVAPFLNDHIRYMLAESMDDISRIVFSATEIVDAPVKYLVKLQEVKDA